MILDLHSHSVRSDDSRAKVENYCQWIQRRELDLDTGIAAVHYEVGDAIYTREVFVSPVDQAVVIRFTCDEPGGLTFDARFARGKAKIEVVGPDTLVVSGIATGKKVKIGSRGFLAPELVASPDLPLAENKVEHSLVFMSYAGQVCGVFVFGDELKPNSIPAVSHLHGGGYRVALVSGDDDQTTKAVAKEMDRRGTRRKTTPGKSEIHFFTAAARTTGGHGW